VQEIVQDLRRQRSIAQLVRTRHDLHAIHEHIVDTSASSSNTASRSSPANTEKENTQPSNKQARTASAVADTSLKQRVHGVMQALYDITF
jgi:hypothetical protein